jgi:iron complex outermembrane receptor protein
VTTLVPVSGQQVPDSPEILFKSELVYDNGNFFARADVNYTDERFYSYLNDASVSDYTLLNVGIGYRFKGFGPIEELLIQADATNVTDEEYFSTIDSNGFPTSDPDRNEQTLLRGAPQQFFLSAKLRF